MIANTSDDRDLFSFASLTGAPLHSRHFPSPTRMRECNPFMRWRTRGLISNNLIATGGRQPGIRPPCAVCCLLRDSIWKVVLGGNFSAQGSRKVRRIRCWEVKARNEPSHSSAWAIGEQVRYVFSMRRIRLRFDLKYLESLDRRVMKEVDLV